MEISTKPLLLSPAGSWESLIAGIQAGTDAVYFGIEQLNMRAKSINNFTINDLEKISETCKQHNIKSYLTLNTILYDHDISLMKKIANHAKDAQIDAVIACDLALLNYCKKIKLPVHISTQANVTNIDTVEFYAEYADTIVLARELTLKQVEFIIKNIKRKKITGVSGELIKVEIFAHGALCMAISGKCYLSLHSHFASANRGACIQNCRRNYLVIDKQDGIELEVDNEYIMSAKDLCTIDFLDKVIASGVAVLKIEGRTRSPEYVYTTTKCYREAIEAVLDKTYSLEKITQWKEQLATVFNRGFWDGYYLGKKMGEWSNTHGSKATQQKTYVGKALNFFDKISVGEFKIETGTLATGDEILITGPTTGIIQTTIQELRIDNTQRTEAIKGDLVSFPLPEKVRKSDKLYKITPV
ncbi:MAG: U32 family peptidase [Bacteroidia bacterium]|nr:U32 family peptidase [Bacteroidia bacterium]